MKNWTTTEMAIGGLALVGGLALFNRYGRDTIGLAPATPTSPPDDDMDNFVNMIPAPTCWSNCANGAQAIYSPGGCPPSHPLTQAPMCAPPPPPAPMVTCDTCMGGSPVSNMFPMQPPGGGPSCPPGWIASGSGNPCATLPPPPIVQPPGITANFMTLMNNGFNQFGCKFIYKRGDIHRNKLRLLQHNTNPNSASGRALMTQMLNWTPGNNYNVVSPNLPVAPTQQMNMVGPGMPQLPAAPNQTIMAPPRPGIVQVMMTTPIAPAGTKGQNPAWQQKLENRINWIDNFALQNCTGGPTPGPGPNPPIPPIPPTNPVPPVRNNSMANAATSMLASAVI